MFHLSIVIVDNADIDQWRYTSSTSTSPSSATTDETLSSSETALLQVSIS